MTYPALNKHETEPVIRSELPAWLRERQRIVVGGSREGQPPKSFERVMDMFTERYYPDIAYAHGAGRGTDEMVKRYCEFYNLQTVEYAAEWDTYGRAAGPMRNEQMLLDFRPHLVIAFPGGPGTKSLVTYAHQFMFEVLEIRKT